MTIVNWTGKYLIGDRMVSYCSSIGSMAKVRKYRTYACKGSIEFLMGLSGSADVRCAAEVAGCSVFENMDTMSKLCSRMTFAVVYVFKAAELKEHCKSEYIKNRIPDGEEYVVIRLDDDVTDKQHENACMLLPSVLLNSDATAVGSGGDYYRIAESMGMAPKEILLSMAEGGAPGCGLGWDVVRFGDKVKKSDHVHLRTIEDIVRMKKKFARKT